MIKTGQTSGQNSCLFVHYILTGREKTTIMCICESVCGCFLLDIFVYSIHQVVHISLASERKWSYTKPKTQKAQSQIILWHAIRV